MVAFYYCKIKKLSLSITNIYKIKKEFAVLRSACFDLSNPKKQKARCA